ncbi:MAG: MauE/DoxX family redox-associated membrane protein [Phycisphaerales bacterium JB040]
MLRITGNMLIGTIAIFFAIAGLAKFDELDEFARSLENWTALPVWSHMLIAVVIPSAELIAGVALLLGLARRWSVVIMAVMLLVFTSLYLYQAAVGEAPDCNCLGKISVYVRDQQIATNVVLRNILFLLVLSGGTTLLKFSPRIQE